MKKQSSEHYCQLLQGLYREGYTRQSTCTFAGEYCSTLLFSLPKSNT